MSERGDWMITVSGRRHYVGAPDPEQIVIDDIAHGLAKYTRFGGHTVGDELYSVAQHSVLVSQIYEVELRLQLDRIDPSHRLDTESGKARRALGALLHDAAEAFLGDSIRPVKLSIGHCYKPLEIAWERAIEHRFDVELTSALIKRCDLIALATERRDLLPFADPSLNPEAWKWKEDELAVEPWPEKIVPWTIRESRQRFLARFDELGGLR